MAWRKRIKECGRPVDTLVIQEQGGTLSTVEKGQAWLRSTLIELAETTTRAPMTVDELIVGAICGGSDGTSGITANPAIGRCFDLLVEHNASALFEEGGELIGREQIMADRAVTPELARRNLLDDGEDGSILFDHGAWKFRRWQCGRRTDNGRGKVNGGIRQERLLPVSRVDQAGRSADVGQTLN